MKRYSTFSVTIREMPVKTTIWYHFTPIRMDTIRKKRKKKKKQGGGGRGRRTKREEGLTPKM